MVSEGWTLLGAGAVVATYLAAAVFYLRLALHALRWAEAAWRSAPSSPRGLGASARSIAGAAVDVVFLRRLLLLNPALWIGEWVFHAALTLVVLRHLRYVTNPVPAWVAGAQTPGWVAGFLLPAALLYVFAVRLLTGREKFSSPVNLLLLLNLLAIAVSGLLLSTRSRTDLAAVKLFALGVVGFAPSPPPLDSLFLCHLGLVLTLVLYLPSHVVAAPLTLVDARRRELELRRVLHDA